MRSDINSPSPTPNAARVATTKPIVGRLNNTDFMWNPVFSSAIHVLSLTV